MLWICINRELIISIASFQNPYCIQFYGFFNSKNQSKLYLADFNLIELAALIDMTFAAILVTEFEEPIQAKTSTVLRHFILTVLIQKHGKI